MPASHGRQKQLAKHKKRRAEGRSRSSLATLPSATERAVLLEAATGPHGPSFISRSWRQDDPELPALVTVVVTRWLRGILVPGVALVDRTCLGVKNGFVGRPGSQAFVTAEVARFMRADPAGFAECDLLLAQSVVFHALDYARSLGFKPHRDFPEVLFGPRPATLLDTPLAACPIPNFMAGPDDPVDWVIGRLLIARPEGDFRVTLGGMLPSYDDEDWDDAWPLLEGPGPSR